MSVTPGDFDCGWNARGSYDPVPRFSVFPIHASRSVVLTRRVGDPSIARSTILSVGKAVGDVEVLPSLHYGNSRPYLIRNTFGGVGVLRPRDTHEVATLPAIRVSGHPHPGTPDGTGIESK